MYSAGTAQARMVCRKAAHSSSTKLNMSSAGGCLGGCASGRSDAGARSPERIEAELRALDRERLKELERTQSKHSKREMALRIELEQARAMLGGKKKAHHLGEPPAAGEPWWW